MAWKLTRGVGHDEIETCLNQLNDRIVEPIRFVIVDDCCASRLLYERIFGENIEVKLDLFHAIQRLTDTLPAKFKYRRKVSNALSMSFRQSDDMGAERTMDTADPQTITQKLDQTIEDLQNQGTFFLTILSTLTKVTSDVPPKDFLSAPFYRNE